MFSDLLRGGNIDGTGVRLLFFDADFRQVVDNRLGFDFQLASQFVNSYLGFVSHPAGYDLSWSLG
jgi:hypothetical protein